MTLKPDWLDEALAGHPVVLRDGKKAYVRHYEEELETEFPLSGFTISDGVACNSIWCLKYILGLWEEPAPVFEHWNLLRKEVVHIAKDKDGVWYGYDISPFKETTVWTNAGQGNANIYGLQGLDSSLFPECDWKHSLIQRPTEE